MISRLNSNITEITIQILIPKFRCNLISGVYIMQIYWGQKMYKVRRFFPINVIKELKKNPWSNSLISFCY